MKNTFKELTDKQKRSINLKILGVSVKVFNALKKVNLDNIPDTLDNALDEALRPLFQKELLEREDLIKQLANLDEQLQLTKVLK